MAGAGHDLKVSQNHAHADRLGATGVGSRVEGAVHVDIDSGAHLALAASAVEGEFVAGEGELVEEHRTVTFLLHHDLGCRAAKVAQGEVGDLAVASVAGVVAVAVAVVAVVVMTVAVVMAVVVIIAGVVAVVVVVVVIII